MRAAVTEGKAIKAPFQSARLVLDGPRVITAEHRLLGEEQGLSAMTRGRSEHDIAGHTA